MVFEHAVYGCPVAGTSVHGLPAFVLLEGGDVDAGQGTNVARGRCIDFDHELLAHGSQIGLRRFYLAFVCLTCSLFWESGGRSSRHDRPSPLDV